MFGLLGRVREEGGIDFAHRDALQYQEDKDKNEELNEIIKYKMIQNYFKELVTQKMFLVDIMHVSVSAAFLFLSFIYFIENEIDHYNNHLNYRMETQVSSNMLMLDIELQQMMLFFNVSNQTESQISNSHLNQTYYQVDFSSQRVINNNSNIELYPAYYDVANADGSELFYALLKQNESYFVQYCSKMRDSLYQCFSTQYEIDLQQYYGVFYIMDNEILSNIHSQCLINDSYCSLKEQIVQNQYQSNNLDQTIAFVESLDKGEWSNQKLVFEKFYEMVDPITTIPMTDVKSFFYIPKNSENQSVSVLDNYKQDLLNQGEEYENQMQDLAKNYHKIQILGTYSDALFDKQTSVKQQYYFFYYQYFCIIISLALLTPIIIYTITIPEFKQISKTLNKVSNKMEFFEIEYDNMNKDLKQLDVNLIELQELVQIFDEFCWLIDFLVTLQKNTHELSKLQQGLLIFKKRQSIECQELILLKLVDQYERQKEYETGVQCNRQLISILEEQKKSIQVTKIEEINRINFKIFQAFNQLLNLLSKHLIRNKGKDRAAWMQAKQLFTNVMDFADTLDIKFTLKIKLLFKKCKLLFNLRKIKEAEQCIDQAQEILQYNYIQCRNSSYQNKQYNQDRKQLQIVQQKIYYYRGLILMSSSQYLPSAQYLMLALEYGNVYKPKQRVQTIKTLSKLFTKTRKFDWEARILKQIQYFYKNQYRVFDFYIDCTMRLGENQLEVAECMKKLFIQMNDDDIIKLVLFDDNLQMLIESQSKQSIIENSENEKSLMEDGFYDLLSGRQTNHSRKLYNAILDSFNEQVPRKYTKYLILMSFGDNADEHSIEEAVERLREEYVHFILCSSLEKKFLNQRSAFKILTEEARDGMYIDLFANFEEGLQKLIGICLQ